MNFTNCENCSTKKGRRRKVCEIHMMLINSVGAHSSKIKSRTSVGLCPVFSKASKKFENIIPAFKNDGKYYTPAFTLPIDESYYDKNDEKYRAEHLKKVVDYCKHKSQMWIPKPNTKNKYCSVCKVDYLDYKEHTETAPHHQCIRNNRYSGFIEEMVEEVQKDNKRRSQYQLFDKPRKCRAVDLEIYTNDDSSKITAT